MFEGPVLLTVAIPSCYYKIAGTQCDIFYVIAQGVTLTFSAFSRKTSSWRQTQYGFSGTVVTPVLRQRRRKRWLFSWGHSQQPHLPVAFYHCPLFFLPIWSFRLISTF
jgi:hypothetical protein